MQKNSQITKIPPHDKSAEQSVLGAILIDPSAISSVAEIISAQAFYFDSHSKLFLAMMSLFEKRQPIDLVTISAELKEMGHLKAIGGTDYIAELIDMVPTSAHIEQYARIVKSDSVKRTLIGLGSKLVEKSFEDQVEVKSLLDFAEGEIFALSQAYLHRDFVELRSILAESFDRLEKLAKEGAGVRGLPTGFVDMDKKLAGMHDSNLIILAARPGVGKTTMALNIALHVAMHAKAPVGIFSLEMSQEELVDRLLVGQADIDAWRLKTGKLTDDDYSRITEAMGELSEAPIYIDDTPGASVIEMRTKARKLKLEKGLKLLIVDYLQLVIPGKRIEGRVQEVSFISQQLKNIARELKIPVIALSQLSRAIEHRAEKKPQLADLRESGCLTGDTLIPLADKGVCVSISELVGQSNVWIWSIDEKFQLMPKKALKIFSTGRKQVFELKFRSGRKIRATANHKFMKATDWVRLDEMKIGEKYALPLSYPQAISESEQFTDSHLIFLAHMIGDGCYVDRQPIHYTSNDMSNIEAVRISAQDAYGITGRIVAQKTWFHIYLPSPYRLARGTIHPFRKWLRSEGADFARSHQKRIPENIFSCSGRQLSLFLHHLWATDGCISVKNEVISVYYATTSDRLANQVQHLLLRLGVQSTLRKIRQVKNDVEYKPSYHIEVQGKTNQMVFFKRIGCFGERGKKIAQAIKILEKKTANPNVGTLGKEIWEELIEAEKNRAGISWREFAKGLEMAYCGSTLFKSGVSPQRLSKIASITNSPTLHNLASSDIYWDELVGINKGEIEDVYDITVPETHNFIANDIVVHNSIEQDADVVMFIYSEQGHEELLDMTMRPYKVFIAKHRNGPTGDFDIMFRGDRVKFYDVDHR